MASRKRTDAQRLFMEWALAKIIARGEAHPLSFLVDLEAKNWKARHGSRRKNSKEDDVAVQAGHLISFKSGAPERLALEDADYNQEKNYTIECQRAGGIVITTAVSIEGIPVESATAQMWDRLGVLKTKGLVKSAPPHLGWAKDDPGK
ncbi:polymorphic toxin type 5 domain-containing protein [Microvirga massiliensis]|uniref:polymorphic toxin type 5 domain-containing protein n=1 Tax=Microvirga massiliensis TaxID=1033741 RepID=UPI00062BB493|nr:polymorphic toxin type 5 domain-containing protein [Microvirga massiliensis]